jgi:hypothetical protein
MGQQVSIATIGIEDKDLTVLKSVLNLVTPGASGVEWRFIDDLAQADIAFLGNLEIDDVNGLVRDLGNRVTLIYCCSRGEAPPPGVRTLAHCPPRANELAAVFSEVQARHAQAPVPAPAPTAAAKPAAASDFFELDHSLAGFIHARLLRLLIDQPLAVTVPGAPCLLVDIHNGVRTVHADPAWFTSGDFLRADPATCQMEVATDARVLSECRRQQTRPYLALRFWGVMSASRGRALADVARAKAVGLKKLPEFKVLPHLAWQPALAQEMVGKTATAEQWAASAGKPVGDVLDFINACAVLSLLKTA